MTGDVVREAAMSESGAPEPAVSVCMAAFEAFWARWREENSVLLEGDYDVSNALCEAWLAAVEWQERQAAAEVAKLRAGLEGIEVSTRADIAPSRLLPNIAAQARAALAAVGRGEAEHELGVHGYQAASAECQAAIEEAVAAERERGLYLVEIAWGIIANAGGGNWDLETEDWREAAIRWRDKYHAALAADRLAAEVEP